MQTQPRTAKERAKEAVVVDLIEQAILCPLVHPPGYAEAAKALFTRWDTYIMAERTAANTNGGKWELLTLVETMLYLSMVSQVAPPTEQMARIQLALGKKYVPEMLDAEDMEGVPDIDDLSDWDKQILEETRQTLRRRQVQAWTASQK